MEKQIMMTVFMNFWDLLFYKLRWRFYRLIVFLGGGVKKNVIIICPIRVYSLTINAKITMFENLLKVLIMRKGPIE